MLTGIVITRHRLHQVLTMAHVALIERDPARAGAYLQVLRDLTAPDDAPVRGASVTETFHAPSLAAEEAQPAHTDTLPDGPGGGLQRPADPPSAEPAAPPPIQAAAEADVATWAAAAEAAWAAAAAADVAARAATWAAARAAAWAGTTHGAQAWDAALRLLSDALDAGPQGEPWSATQIEAGTAAYRAAGGLVTA